MFVIIVYLLAYAFHQVLPICHYIFGCDHGIHGVTRQSEIDIRCRGWEAPGE